MSEFEHQCIWLEKSKHINSHVFISLYHEIKKFTKVFFLISNQPNVPTKLSQVSFCWKTIVGISKIRYIKAILHNIYKVKCLYHI